MSSPIVWLHFNVEAVAGLVEHCANSKLRRMTMDQRAEIYGEGLAIIPQPDEEARTPPALWFVKDDGIYLMSPGRDETTRPPVAYAQGYEPDAEDVWERSREAVGGDDFAIALPLDGVREKLDATINARQPTFAVRISD